MENSIRVVQEWYKETSRNALQDALAEERYYGKVDGEKIGEKKGEKKSARRIAVEMFKDGFKMEAVAKYCPILDREELLSLQAKALQ